MQKLNKLNLRNFEEFYHKLHGFKPFTWQSDLTKKVLEGNDGNNQWPGAIALPTASGKTACIDIAIFALAAQAERLENNKSITAPRRIFYVVDRRVIVDQAYERAINISKQLKEAKNGILKDVADCLRKIGSGYKTNIENQIPLSTHILRGGMYRSETWTRDPLQPTVVASTVDQIGSRLLFRSYGHHRSNTWPIYAGLIANDSLVFLDEAHCAQPFMQTLQSILKFRQWAHTPLGRSFYPVVMSATPPNNTSEIFEDRSQDNHDPKNPLCKRQKAHKIAKLRIYNESCPIKKSHALATAAKELITDNPNSIVVFTNRVMTARETYKILSKNKDVDTMLLTGRMRQIDKNEILEQLKKFRPSSEKPKLKKPWIVIATQTLEVGADLDFDALVTECASLDALRQRFGRLERMGHNEKSHAIILISSEDTDPQYDDPIYGTALTKTWALLNDIKVNESIDFGILSLEARIGKKNLDELNAPHSNAPTMLPIHIDCWSQTYLEPHHTPDVKQFIRGQEAGSPDVQVCWRSNLDLNSNTWKDVLKLCPPCSIETVPVTIGSFKKWLAEKSFKNDSDIEGHGEDYDKYVQLNEECRVIVWNGIKSNDSYILTDVNEIKPYSTIVIPSDHPRSNALCDFATSVPLDVSEYAYLLARAKPVICLHENTIQQWPPNFSEDVKAITDLLNNIETYNENRVPLEDEIFRILKNISKKEISGYWSWLPKVGQALIAEYGKNWYKAYDIVGDNVMIRGKRRIKHYSEMADMFGDEDDFDLSSMSHKNGMPVKLSEHLKGVEKLAKQYAVSCGLPDNIINAITKAGSLHDIGKSYPPFQSLLAGKKIWSIDEYFAKSSNMPQNNHVSNKIKQDIGYPKGWRHEVLSVRLAEKSDSLPKCDIDRDLVLHLIASHHGYCRPFVPMFDDSANIKSNFQVNGKKVEWTGATKLEIIDSGVADRYWRLTREYGWWGLAWLESILRLADWRRSEWEESHDGE